MAKLHFCYNNVHRCLEQLAKVATDWTGTSGAFILAAGVVALWLFGGPYFDWSDTYQLYINTGTTIVTFLMVFLIQRAQNKDSKAIHLKLDELIASQPGASSHLLNIEDLSEQDIHTLLERYRQLKSRHKTDTGKYSIDELLKEEE